MAHTIHTPQLGPADPEHRVLTQGIFATEDAGSAVGAASPAARPANARHGADYGRFSVLVVGLGALGCPAARELVRAGIGRITLVDDDVVEESNLQRQILFSTSDLGQPKVTAARASLTKLGARTRIDTQISRLDETNAKKLIAAHDFVIDACDDPTTKFLINSTCVATSTPYCYGGVLGLAGQWMTIQPGVTPCLECVFEASELFDDQGGGCSSMGILAPIAGVVGTMQAAEALHVLSSRGAAAGSGLYLYRLTGPRWRRVNFRRAADCPRCAPLKLNVAARSQTTCPS